MEVLQQRETRHVNGRFRPAEAASADEGAPTG